MKSTIWVYMVCAFVLAEQHGGRGSARALAQGFSAKAKELVTLTANFPAYQQWLQTQFERKAFLTSEENTGTAWKSDGSAFDLQTHKINPQFLVEQWKNKGMTAEQMAVTLAVLEVGGKSALGEYDPFLCQMSDAYAQSDARAQRQQGHAGWGSRFQKIIGYSQYQKDGTRVYAAENEAESWPWFGDDLMLHARNCVESWMHSSGHKMAMMNFRTRFCHTMALGQNGTAYCISEFQDNLPPGARRP